MAESHKNDEKSPENVGETIAPKKKPGGQPGNRNSMRHGLRSGQLPKDLKYVELRLNGLRRQLEDLVTTARGEVTLTDAALIQTVLRYEKVSACAQAWLNKAYKELSPRERLDFIKEVATASALRDKSLLQLKLDRDSESAMFDALYARPVKVRIAANDDNAGNLKDK